MKQTLIEILKAWNTGPLPTVKPRSTNLLNFFDPKVKKILSVVGFRRVGKTFTLFDFVQKYGKENCLYVNFEDERLPSETNVLTSLMDAVQELKGNQPLVLLLDEIQEIPNWSKWARRVNETSPHHLILSGSSSKLSSHEIPTELRGQTLTINIFPLSFQEFLDFKQLKKAELPTPHILNALREYLNFGGMPEVVLAEEGLKPLLLTEYFNTFVVRDLIERFHLRNEDALRDLLRLLLNTRMFTYSKLANTLKSLGHNIGKATVIRYMRWIESSYFAKSLELCSPSVKRKIQAAKKAYIIDNYFSARFSTAFSQNLGHLMEQAVYSELSRRVFRDPLLEVAYWKDYAQHEVDFVLKRGSRIETLHQVTFASSMSEVAEREIRSLQKAAKELKCDHQIIITWDFEQMENSLQFIPLWKWLLQ